MSDALWRLGAAELAARIAAGRATAAAAVESALTRIAEVNGALNAIVDDQSEAARARAAELDAAFAASGPVGPLHGVPVTIKVNVDQAGCATTNGVAAYRDVIAAEDAPVVASLKRAGAVIVGRTNTPEFSFRADTDGPLHGRTYNPWRRDLSPGGSSGGAAVAVMSGMCALAHGNDIGGSLRFPAMATGASSLAPGLGRVPAYNPSQTEERGILAQHMSVQGVMARSAADVRLGLRTLVAHDPRDPWQVPMPFEGPPPRRPIKVAFTRETFEYDLHPDVAAALETARAALSDAGYVVEEVEPPMLRELARLGYRALHGEVKVWLGPAIREHGSPRIQRVFEGFHKVFPPLEGEDLLRAMAKRSTYARAWRLFLEEWPLVLTPFLPQPIFAADRDAEGVEGMEEALGAALYSYAVNFLGLPAGLVAAGMSGGAPVSVQVIGQRWREDLVLDACAAVEGRAGSMAERLFDRGLDLG